MCFTIVIHKNSFKVKGVSMLHINPMDLWRGSMTCHGFALDALNSEGEKGIEFTQVYSK